MIIWLLDVFVINPSTSNNQIKYEKFSEKPRLIISAKYIEPYSTWKEVQCDDSYEIKGSGFDFKNVSGDCSDCETHEGSYYVIDEKAESIKINKKQYEFIKRIWKIETKISMNRKIEYNNGCGLNGDMFLIKPNPNVNINIFVHSNKIKHNDNDGFIHHLFYKNK